MVIEVTETNYKGFFFQYVKGQGWQIVLLDRQIVFPTFQDAKIAVDQFYKDIVPKHNGKTTL